MPHLEGIRIGLIEKKGTDHSYKKDISSIASTIFTKFKNLKGLALEFEGLTITNREVKQLASVLRDNGQSLTSLEIKIGTCIYVEADGFTEFNEEILKGLPNLISLSLDFTYTQINNKAIFVLSEKISQSCKNLQTLVINTPDCNGITLQAPRYLAHQLSLNPLKFLKHLEFNAGGKLKDTKDDVRKMLGWDIDIQIN